MSQTVVTGSANPGAVRRIHPGCSFLPGLVFRQISVPSVPFPISSIGQEGNGTRSPGLKRQVRADGVAPRQPLHLALRSELAEGIDDALVANLKAGAEILDGHRLGGCRQQVEDPAGKGVGCGRRWGSVAGDEFEMSAGGVGLRELEGDGSERRSRPVLGGEGELVVMFPQVQEGIEPGVEIRRAAQAVSGAGGGRDVFADVVDERDGGAGLALERP